MPKLRSDFPVPISTRVPREVAERIDRVAERERRSVAAVVRLCLEEKFGDERQLWREEMAEAA